MCIRVCVLHRFSSYFPCLVFGTCLQVPAAGEGQVKRLGPMVREEYAGMYVIFFLVSQF